MDGQGVAGVGTGVPHSGQVEQRLIFRRGQKYFGLGTALYKRVIFTLGLFPFEKSPTIHGKLSVMTKKRYLNLFKSYGIDFTQYQVLEIFVSGSRPFENAAMASYETTRDFDWSASCLDDYREALVTCLNQSILRYVSLKDVHDYRMRLSAEKKKQIPNCECRFLRAFDIDFTPRGYRLFQKIRSDRGGYTQIGMRTAGNKGKKYEVYAPSKLKLAKYFEFQQDVTENTDMQLQISEIIPVGSWRLSRFELFSRGFLCRVNEMEIKS